MKPLVSILIPAYNAERWIAATLRSASEQTWERKEIIVVDDGSTDGTVGIVRRYESTFLKLIVQDHQGAAAARNRALAASQGAYLQWLDADDLLAPDKVALQLRCLEQNFTPCTLASCSWGRFMYRHERTQLISNALWRDLSPLDWLVHKLEHNLFMPTACWLVSRELTAASGEWNTAMLVDDDGEYFCRVLLGSDGVRFVPEAKVFYRYSGPGTLSHIGTSESKREAQWRSVQLHIAYIRSLEDTRKVRDACVRYLQHWLLCFYPERLDIVKEAEALAQLLGGQLVPPRLSWKYSWIKSLLGWHNAKRARASLLNLRWSATRFWDRCLYHLESSALRLTDRDMAE